MSQEKDGQKTLLIADDEANIRRVLQMIFTKDGYAVQVAENGRQALEIAAQQPIHVLMTDLIMPDINGVELIKKIKERQPETVAILLTAYATITTCVEAMRYGASDYITKPFDNMEIRAIVKRAVARAAELSAGTVAIKKSRAGSASDALNDAESPAMQEVGQMVSRAARSRATVLIRGESGTGKEVVARALHEQSDRAEQPFVAVSCAALSETLLESELFGHEKNAFTGAATERKGRFELAHGGTLFLDEIGEISPAVQVKLLRALQEREFERVGGMKTLKVDVRVIAATNADLEQLIREGKFREDLYYRLQVIQLRLPPLRQRREDIPRLAAFFMERFAQENGREIRDIDAELQMHLAGYSWPGNVRQLENIMERCVVMSDPQAKTLTADLLPSELRQSMLSLAA